MESSALNAVSVPIVCVLCFVFTINIYPFPMHFVWYTWTKRIVCGLVWKAIIQHCVIFQDCFFYNIVRIKFSLDIFFSASILFSNHFSVAREFTRSIRWIIKKITKVLSLLEHTTYFFQCHSFWACANTWFRELHHKRLNFISWIKHTGKNYLYLFCPINDVVSELFPST